MNFIYKSKIFSINHFNFKNKSYKIKKNIIIKNMYNEEYYMKNNILDNDKLEKLTKETIKESWIDNVPGNTEKEKKEWCIKKLNLLLETFDNFIPVIGAFLDNPFVDDLQSDAIRLLVDKFWYIPNENDKDFSIDKNK